MRTPWEHLQTHLEARREMKRHAEMTVMRVIQLDSVTISKSAARWLADSYGWRAKRGNDRDTWLLRRGSETLLLRALAPSEPASWRTLEAASGDAWRDGAENVIVIAIAGSADPDLQLEYPNARIYGFDDLVNVVFSA